MKPKTIILITMSLFAFLGIFAVIFSRLSSGSHISLPDGATETFERVYSEDGTILPLTAITPSGQIQGRVIFVADESLDRNWNSRSIQYKTGEDLARSLAKAGFASILYDQRGSGESVISGMNRPDTKNLVFDLNQIRKAGEKYWKDAPEILLAHGNACAISLRAVEESGVRPAGMILTGCAYSGSLLENWGSRLLENMKRSSVEPEVMQQASRDLRHWLDRKAGRKEDPSGKKRESTTDDIDVSPDLLAFYNALQHMDSEKKITWTEGAAGIYPQKLIESLLGRGVLVQQLLGEYDAEIPESELEATLVFKATHKNIPYELRIISGVDHFLKDAGSRPDTDMEKLFFRINPAKVSSMEALQEFVSSAKAIVSKN